MIRVVGPRTFPPNNVPTRVLEHDGIIPVVNTTSRGQWKGLSPFHCGPVPLYEDLGQALLVENAWQFAKVYYTMINPETGLPDDRYLQWAREGWASQAPQRYPMGKGTKYAYLWWGAAHGPLTRPQGRRLIYIPSYARAVTQTEDFHRLVQTYREHGRIYLWDFDGQLDDIPLSDRVEDERPLGHAYILKALLERLCA